MSGYTKLFNSILASTIWREPHHVRVVWITMLAMANKHGIVEASVPGLADMARVSVEECEQALTVLRAPDPYSRTRDNEGKRIQDVDGGFLLLNHAKYRDAMSADDRRDYHRAYWHTRKSRNDQDSTPTQQNSTNSTPTQTNSTDSIHAEAAPAPAPTTIEYREGGANGSRPASVCDSDWLAGLSSDPAYRGVDVAHVHAKLLVWCRENRKHPTRKRLLNWLNREDRVIDSQPSLPLTPTATPAPPVCEWV